MPSALIKAAGSTDSPVPLLGVVKPLPGDAVACRGADCLLLDGVQDPGNVGTMLRTAAAAGARHAICGPGCAALWSPKVLRAARGAHVALNLIETADLVRAVKESPKGFVIGAQHQGNWEISVMGVPARQVGVGEPRPPGARRDLGHHVVDIALLLARREPVGHHHDDPAALEAAKAFGAQETVRKPFSPNVPLAAVTRTLDAG